MSRAEPENGVSAPATTVAFTAVTTLEARAFPEQFRGPAADQRSSAGFGFPNRADTGQTMRKPTKHGEKRGLQYDDDAGTRRAVLDDGRVRSVAPSPAQNGPGPGVTRSPRAEDDMLWAYGRINERGFAVNSELAKRIILVERALIADAVQRVPIDPEVLSNPNRLIRYLKGLGYELPDARPHALASLLAGSGVPPNVRAVLYARLVSTSDTSPMLARTLEKLSDDRRYRNAFHHLDGLARRRTEQDLATIVPRSPYQLDVPKATEAVMDEDLTELSDLAHEANTSPSVALSILASRCIVAAPEHELAVVTFPLVVERMRGWLTGPKGGNLRRVLDVAAAEALKGTPSKAGRCMWERDGTGLSCTLPSGRRITYDQVLLARLSTPGCANLATRVTLAACRDLLAHSLVALERADVRTVMHTHDEIVAEVPEGKGYGTVRDLCSGVPRWAEGLPVGTRCSTGSR